MGRFVQVLHAYAPVVTPYIASELLNLGQNRVYEALFEEREMHSIGNVKKVSLYQYSGPDEVAMMGSVEISGHVLDAHRYLGNQLQTLSNEMHAIGALFGSIFLDGYILHTVPHPNQPGPYEQMDINWMALQAPHSSLNDRDYVFLHYADVYFRNDSELLRVTADELSIRQNHDSRLVACHIWESVELDGTDPLPHLALDRQQLSKWYFTCEAIAPGRVRVSCVMTLPTTSFYRGYIEKLLLHLGHLDTLLSKQCDDSPICNLCLKTFSLFRRKLQCRQCKLNFCSKCILTNGVCNACHEGNPMSHLRRIAANLSDSDSVHSGSTSATPLSPSSHSSNSHSDVHKAMKSSSIQRRSSDRATTWSHDDLDNSGRSLDDNLIRVDFKWTTQ
ncbi:cleavage induced hypothetical protein [Thraustotheca clavata]|uniref:FYVE-type domain-containing protein n=1 Tax=Thraustotheca clavata TaxID=74557 RepID=A0A1V9ZNU7_9STRA|nr:cleavage induced hypothetical protein [Thraustotheca clavata]